MHKCRIVNHQGKRWHKIYLRGSVACRQPMSLFRQIFWWPVHVLTSLSSFILTWVLEESNQPKTLYLAPSIPLELLFTIFCGMRRVFLVAFLHSRFIVHDSIWPLPIHHIGPPNGTSISPEYCTTCSTLHNTTPVVISHEICERNQRSRNWR